jgi:integrase
MKVLDTNISPRDRARPRSLPIQEWPDADRRAWEDACRPGVRLKPGGAASHLGQISRDDFANRYGAFLGFLLRGGCLDRHAAAAAQVTFANVDAYVAELTQRVRSVTVWNCVYKLRWGAELLVPGTNYTWLAELEKDLDLVMVPRSKSERWVFTQRLVKAGLTLVAEAERYAKNDIDRARGIRNGLMIALLAYIPCRLKNFATLEIGSTFKEVNGSWWIVLPASSTKMKRPDERRVPQSLNHAIDVYLSQARRLLIGSKAQNNSLWISSRTGRQLTQKNLGTLISKITFRTLGVDVSPHLFRTAAATTAAMYGGKTPHLASAVLGHTDPRITEDHYIRATSIEAAKIYAAIVAQYQTADLNRKFDLSHSRYSQVLARITNFAQAGGDLTVTADAAELLSAIHPQFVAVAQARRPQAAVLSPFLSTFSVWTAGRSCGQGAPNPSAIWSLPSFARARSELLP